MTFFETIEKLQEKITELVHHLNPELIKSITGYELYKNAFLSKFKV